MLGLISGPKLGDPVKDIGRHFIDNRLPLSFFGDADIVRHGQPIGPKALLAIDHPVLADLLAVDLDHIVDLVRWYMHKPFSLLVPSALLLRNFTEKKDYFVIRE
jgi:hypothetical protein